ncbi:hypothetical protein Hdeb2414_s0007g00240061 [Helianthus debilis subsp. tardiflorus]
MCWTSMLPLRVTFASFGVLNLGWKEDVEDDCFEEDSDLYMCIYLREKEKGSVFKVTWLGIWMKTVKSYKREDQNGTKVSFWTNMENMSKPQRQK